jgi:hypothetical protein
MLSHIRWAKTYAIAAALTLFVVGAAPAIASAHGIRGRVLHGGKSSAAALSRATPKVNQARGRTLIFGEGDEIGANPSLPVTDLQNILTNAGYGVDVSSTLPTNLNQYKAIWFLDTNALSGSEETSLENFVNSGRGLYLTGERPCCDALDNASDQTIINALVTGGGVQVGGLGDADSATTPNAVDQSAIDDMAFSPNVLSTWTPDEPGGMAGVAPDNVLTSTDFNNGQVTPTGAVWDGSNLNGGVGRLAILMDINWLESNDWDATTATQMVVNLEGFLMSKLPVVTAANTQWAGYAAKAHGVRDVVGEFTVPTVDCTQAPIGSAVGVWVGIDGFGNSKLVKAGVGVTCASPTSAPCYYLFTEVHPGAENPFTGCGGVSPGDAISVDVTNSPFGSSTFVATVTDNNSPVAPPITLTAPSKRDRSAECVVQLPPGDVGPTPAHYTDLADFGSVSFSECQATASQNAGNSLDVDQLASGSDGAFTVKALTMGRLTKPKATTGAPDFPDPSWVVTWLSAH